MNVQVAKEILRTRPKTFIAILVLCLCDICFYAFGSAYQKPRLEQLQAKWFQMRKNTAAGDAQGHVGAYLQGERDLKVWRERIIPKRGFPGFIGTLFETAANNSLLFRGVTYKVTQISAENLALYSLDFTVTGKYASIKSFISDLGRLREMVTIDNISLNNSSETGDAVGLKVQLSVYLRMEEQ